MPFIGFYSPLAGCLCVRVRVYISEPCAGVGCMFKISLYSLEDGWMENAAGFSGYQCLSLMPPAGQEERKQAGRYPRDPAVQHGKPLPGKGTCKHFKQSQRWLRCPLLCAALAHWHDWGRRCYFLSSTETSLLYPRFPCCGRAYPCDLCHDADQDHPMERATRMLCGHCAKEQVSNLPVNGRSL